MYMLEIGFAMQSRSIPFRNKEDAEKALAELQPKIGARLYGDNGERQRTHTIVAEIGTVVVEVEKVEFAAVLDAAISSDIASVHRTAAEDREIEFLVRKKRALADPA